MKIKKYASDELEPGQMLWHYTDFAGLQGIVEGKMWASNLRFVNDTKEFHYGVEIAIKVLTEEFRNDGEHFQSVLASLTDFMPRYRGDEFYAISFSEKEDDLSQWRGYGADGRPSFALGFDARKLEEKAAECDFILHHVLYEENKIATNLADELKPMIALLRRQLADDPTITVKKFTDRAGAAIIINLLQILASYKHPKFEVEDEWRLIRRQPVLKKDPFLKLLFRQSRSLVVPYFELPLHTVADQLEVLEDAAVVESPLVAITIGPTPHKQELEFAVGEMTSRNGLTLAIQPSAIPYRNW